MTKKKKMEKNDTKKEPSRMANITYIYRRSDYGGNNNGNQGIRLEHYSRHHIISYPFMNCFAIVLLWYAANENKTNEKLNNYLEKNKIEKEKISENLKTNGRVLDLSYYRGFISSISWAEANLFIGPAGCYREDDPSQKMEYCPVNMPVKQKELASKVKTAWDAVSKSRLVGNEGDKISISVNVNKLDDFVNVFIDYINYTSDIYVTRYDDWYLVKEGKKYNFWIDESDNWDIIEEKPEKFQFMLRKGDENGELKSVRVIKWGKIHNGKAYVEGVSRKLSNNQEFLKKQFVIFREDR